jgi:DNA-binding PadR family transcriptional regulator
MNPQDHLPLAPRDLLILAVLAGGPQHGYGIIKAVEARSESGVLLDPANLYRVLRRMRGLGWIRETDGSVAPSREGAEGGAGTATKDGPTFDEGGGRNGFPSRRRTYEIAPEGKLLLSSELARLERLLRQVRPALASREGR